jgi:hypothetical protein
MFVALMLLTAAQISQPAPVTPTDQRPAKMECRNITEPGSRIPSRVCKLHDEWEAMAKAAQDDVRNTRNQRETAVNPE